jgi:hypothetical protein
VCQIVQVWITSPKPSSACKVQLLTPRMAARLQPVDPLALKAGLLGSNPAGLFKH